MFKHAHACANDTKCDHAEVNERNRRRATMTTMKKSNNYSFHGCSDETQTREQDWDIRDTNALDNICVFTDELTHSLILSLFFFLPHFSVLRVLFFHSLYFIVDKVVVVMLSAHNWWFCLKAKYIYTNIQSEKKYVYGRSTSCCHRIKLKHSSLNRKFIKKNIQHFSLFFSNCDNCEMESQPAVSPQIAKRQTFVDKRREKKNEEKSEKTTTRLERYTSKLNKIQTKYFYDLSAAAFA